MSRIGRGVHPWRPSAAQRTIRADTTRANTYMSTSSLWSPSPGAGPASDMRHQRAEAPAQVP